MASCHILVTGFGPFPGVPENNSGWLVEALARRRLASRLGCAIETRVLPTEWSQVSLLGPALLRTHRPRLILHLGVSGKARGFRIERAAHNRIVRREDASGALHGKRQILDYGAQRLDTEIPVPDLAKHLRGLGLPAITSPSAGSYLCNFLYYHSLDWASRQKRRADVCFVHVPHGEDQGGTLGEAELLRGTEAILRYLIAHADRTDSAAPPRPAPRRAMRAGAARG